MARMGNFNTSGLRRFQQNLNKIQEEQINAFCEECAKKVAARLLSAVIKRTPVGSYTVEVEVTAKRDSKNHKKGDKYTKKANPSGRQGGVLRRGWISDSQKEAENNKTAPQAEEVLEYANGIEVRRIGDTYVIEIKNPVEYASYVEYGHKQTPGRYVPALGKTLKKRWVRGQLMMTKSAQEIEKAAPGMLEKEIMKFLGGAFQ